MVAGWPLTSPPVIPSRAFLLCADLLSHATKTVACRTIPILPLHRSKTKKVEGLRVGLTTHHLLASRPLDWPSFEGEGGHQPQEKPGSSGPSAKDTPDDLNVGRGGSSPASIFRQNLQPSKHVNPARDALYRPFATRRANQIHCMRSFTGAQTSRQENLIICQKHTGIA